MKKEQKDKLKSMDVKELTKELDKLQMKRIKLESNMRTFNGSSKLVRNYPDKPLPQGSKHGNLRNIKKDMARIKTWLNVKMKR